MMCVTGLCKTLVAAISFWRSRGCDDDDDESRTTTGLYTRVLSFRVLAVGFLYFFSHTILALVVTRTIAVKSQSCNLVDFRAGASACFHVVERNGKPW